MCFSFLKTFHLSSSKRFLQFRLTGGELQAFKPCVEASLESLWPPAVLKDGCSSLTSIDCFTPLSNHPSSLAKMFTLLSSKEWFFSFRLKWISKSWPEESALLSCFVSVYKYQNLMDELPRNLLSTFMLLYCAGHSVHFPLTNLNLIGRSPIYFIHFFPGGGSFF